MRLTGGVAVAVKSHHRSKPPAHDMPAFGGIRFAPEAIMLVGLPVAMRSRKASPTPVRRVKSVRRLQSAHGVGRSRSDSLRLPSLLGP